MRNNDIKIKGRWRRQEFMNEMNNQWFQAFKDVQHAQTRSKLMSST